MKALAILAGIILLSGCEVFARYADKSAEAVARGVGEYCANFTADQRAEFRSKVNELTDPDTIEVECAE